MIIFTKFILHLEKSLKIKGNINEKLNCKQIENLVQLLTEGLELLKVEGESNCQNNDIFNNDYINNE